MGMETRRYENIFFNISAHILIWLTFIILLVNTTKNGGQIKILIDKMCCKCHREFKNTLFIKICYKTTSLWLF